VEGIVEPLLGKTVSHYRIVDKLGAGGMGEVYRARDTRSGSSPTDVAMAAGDALRRSGIHKSRRGRPTATPSRRRLR